MNGRMNRRDTPQLLDPLGGLTARYFTRLIAIITALVAVGRLLTSLDTVRDWPLQFAALGALLLTIIVVLDGASPRRFPFRGSRHAAVHLFGLAAVAFDISSRASGEALPGLWSTTCIAILIVIMGSFRPSTEIIVFATASALAIAGMCWVHGGLVVTDNTVPLIVGRAWPILAVGLGAAAFSRTLVGRLQRWRDARAAASAAELDAVRETLIPQVSWHRQDLVEYRVEPFLRTVLASGTLTPTDAARARGLASAMRKSMLFDANSSWLSGLVDVLDDEGRRAGGMTIPQRAALSALLAELRAVDVHCAITGAGDTATALIRADLETGPRVRPDAYLAVLRVTFDRASVTIDREQLQITVSYRTTHKENPT
ncbi:hypothetical protein BH10ACT7_BH10ACT7_01090 [soil metagenome]